MRTKSLRWRDGFFAKFLGITPFNLLHEFPELEEVRPQAISELPRTAKRWLRIVFE